MHGCVRMQARHVQTSALLRALGAAQACSATDLLGVGVELSWPCKNTIYIS